MKILIITSRYLPIFNKNNEGAIEKLERIYLKYNERASDEITVYSPKIADDNYDRNVMENTHFRNIDQTTVLYKIKKCFGALKRRIMRSDNNECYIREIVKDLKKHGEQDLYDLIIFENSEKDIPIFKKLTKTRSKIVLHLHNDYVNTETRGSEAIVYACDEVWTVSEFLAKRVNEVARTKTIVIPNTIDNPSAKTSIRGIERLKKRYNPDDGIVFVYIGRLLECKGLPQLLMAFDEFSRLMPNCKLLLIGKTESGKKGRRIRKKIQEYISKNARIEEIGFVAPEDIPNYQAIAHYQVIPSMWNEAFGLVVLEAMRANLKIIATRSGGIPEICQGKIEYVERQNIVSDLVKKFKDANTNKLPPDYYSEILNRYSVQSFCKNIYGAIHESEK